jgi:superfamily II DNA or RNA helicase
MAKTPRPYQIQGIEDIYKAWEVNGLTMFIMATGLGKTAVSMFIIKNFLSQGKRVMFIAHRTELIMQTKETLLIEGIQSGVIKSGHPRQYAIPCQVCSIQTAVKRKDLPPTDLIIIDEAHHVTDDNSYYKILEQYPEAKVLLLTATPYRLSGQGFKNIVPNKETQLVLNLTLSEAVKQGWLCGFKYFIGTTPDLSTIRVVRGEYDEEDAKKAMDLVPLVETYEKHAKGKQGLVFCVNVAHSKEVCQMYNEAGIITAHIDGTTPADERQAILEAFKRKEIMVVTNVGVFTEGTDFPNCEFVQLARPIKSLSLFLQMVGRGTRAEAGLVDKHHTPEERLEAIAKSSKPYCIVLDNAGCWKDNGFPDEERNWQAYFEGIPKKKPKAEAEEYIEVYEYEDPTTGIRKKTKNINELEDMILIEVTKEIRELLTKEQSINEFYKIYNQLKYAPNVQMLGYVAYDSFMKHCKRHKIVVTKNMWKKMADVLCTPIEKQIEEYIRQQAQQGKRVVAHADKHIKQIKKLGIARSVLRVMYKDYADKYKQTFSQELP